MLARTRSKLCMGGIYKQVYGWRSESIAPKEGWYNPPIWSIHGSWLSSLWQQDATSLDGVEDSHPRIWHGRWSGLQEVGESRDCLRRKDYVEVVIKVGIGIWWFIIIIVFDIQRAFRPPWMLKTGTTSVALMQMPGVVGGVYKKGIRSPCE